MNQLPSLLPSLTTPTVLVTSIGPNSIDERYQSDLDNPLILHWYSTNATLTHPKLTCIPLGITPPKALQWRTLFRPSNHIQDREILPECYFKEKPIKMYVNWSPSHPKRKEILKHFAAMKGCYRVHRIPFVNYIDDMSRSEFVISPRGGNIDCYRTWEALYVGSIPVVEEWGISSVYEGLPVIVVPDLSVVTHEMLCEEREKLRSKVFDWDRLKASYWTNLIRSQA